MSPVITRTIKFSTKGDGDIVNLTPEMETAVAESGLMSGTVTAFVPGSTAGITTVEHEPGLLQDIPELMEKLVPSDRTYQHNETWKDGNGYSHLRAALIGPGVTVPFYEGRMTLGTWQQVVFLDFDNRSRNRRVVFQLMGE
ncbi:MAG: YjbQ family protein [bacterium]|nr:YjbQ family protein [bacterium]